MEKRIRRTIEESELYDMARKLIDEESFEIMVDELVNSLAGTIIQRKETGENFVEKLKKYFEETSREKVLEDWEKSKEFDDVGASIFVDDRPECDFYKKGGG